MVVAALIALAAGISFGWWLRSARHSSHSRVLEELYSRKLRFAEGEREDALNAVQAKNRELVALAERVTEVERTCDAARLAEQEATLDCERAELSLEEACAELSARKAEVLSLAERTRESETEREALRADLARRELELREARAAAEALALDLEAACTELGRRGEELQALCGLAVEVEPRMAAPVLVPAPSKRAVPAAPAPRKRAEHDDLKRIAGIGSALEKKLHRAGVTSYRQLAALTRDDLAELAHKVGIPVERMRREGWVGSARDALRSRTAV